jgi:raffinose/stachyose/melibiose transport system permease protein
MLLFGLIYAAPIVTVTATAFTRYTAAARPVFAGGENFAALFRDKDFQIAVKNTLVWVLLQTTVHVSIGLGMALILHKKPKGWKVARTVYLIPNIVPTAATGIMFMLLLNPQFGVVKGLYKLLSISGPVPNLFGNSRYAFVTVTCTWLFYSAFNTVIFLAQLGSVDKAIYEAAAIDGASPWQTDRHINLPALRGTIGTCVLLASVAMVSQFDIIYMTTRGGPGTATLNLPVYLYKTMNLENNYGKANAVGVVQIILGLGLAGLIRLLFGEKKSNRETEAQL